MDGLQHSLLAPTCGTFILVLGCVDAMMQMVHVRYSAEAKDEQGKSLLPHPYKPWEVPVSKPDSTQPPPPEIYDKAYRAFKMYENVKEWTFLSLPLMWTFAVYGKNAVQPCVAFVAASPWIPMTTETMIDSTVVLTSVLYAVANRQYVTGYIASVDGRIPPFYRRTNIVKFWLTASALSLAYACFQRVNLVA